MNSNDYTLAALGRFPFYSNNAYILYIPNDLDLNGADRDKISDMNKLISNIVFKYLNNGKVIIYKGESASWEGRVTRKYYLNWRTDEDGLIDPDSYDSEMGVLNYKLPNHKDLGTMQMEYTAPHGGGTITGENLLNIDNTITFGNSGNEGNQPYPTDVYNITVTLNGKQEKLTLEAN